MPIKPTKDDLSLTFRIFLYLPLFAIPSWVGANILMWHNLGDYRTEELLPCISSSCCNKVLWTGWLKPQNKLIPPSSRGQEIHGQVTSTLGVRCGPASWVRDTLPLCPDTAGRKRELSGTPFLRALSPFPRAVPSWLNTARGPYLTYTPPKVPTSKCHHAGLGFRMC